LEVEMRLKGFVRLPIGKVGWLSQTGAPNYGREAAMGSKRQFGQLDL
jgi:hypothetical protein